jgi:NitT/TauT family transport system permease protein
MDTTTTINAVAAPAGVRASQRLVMSTGRGLYNFFAGLAILFALWWIGVLLITRDSGMAHFAGFGPMPAFHALAELWHKGAIGQAIWASGFRLGTGLLIAIAIGVPVGILMGRSKLFAEIGNTPFQLLRMISPLSWEPIAVIVFAGWDQAIIFLIAVGAVWPVMFSTAAGLAKVDPNWFKVARNLGARPRHVLTQIIIPAISYDVVTGIRLALGVSWIVLVPAEFFGVTSGLGYTIEDARESLDYDHLMAMVLVIGAIGYLLDSVFTFVLRNYCWSREQ